jgi:hypothetical protein
MNDRIYIHEVIDIVGLGRAGYVHHMTANWSPSALEERNQRCFGVWPVIGSTGRWPQVVNMWELESWEGLAHGFDVESRGRGAYDARLERWWAKAFELRSGGFDRIMIPAPWTRTIDELCEDGVQGACYAHELVTLRPGSQADLLDAVREQGVTLAGEHDWELVGAWRTMMGNDDECTLIWAIPTWDRWTAYERTMAEPSALRAWRRSLDDVVTDWHRLLMVDAPLGPLRTGRQPRREDQTDWNDEEVPLAQSGARRVRLR